jgi:hypothetical protein
MPAANRQAITQCGRTEPLFQLFQLYSSFVRAGRYSSNFSNKLYLQIINGQQLAGADTASTPTLRKAAGRYTLAKDSVLVFATVQ